MKGRRGSTDTVAFTDCNSVIDPKGQTKMCTVRRLDCDVLCKRVSSFPLPCHSCHSFRSTLRSSLSRQKSSSQDDRTNVASGTGCKVDDLALLHHLLEKPLEFHKAQESQSLPKLKEIFFTYIEQI